VSGNGAGSAGVPDGAFELSGEAGAPNAAWTWYTDERAVVDPDADGGPRLLVGSVSAGGSEDEDESESGDIDVLWYDLGSEERGRAELHDRLEQDDHNCPALFVRPDGRYLAVYAKHGSDPHTRWRVSTEPHDPTEWTPERTRDNGAGTTYANVYRLPDDAGGEGRTYSFTRTRNFDPNVLVSRDAGSTWRYGGHLLKRGGDSQRPYVRYASDGDAIHLTTTEEHPRRVKNGVYHGYVEDGRLYDSTGAVVDEDVLDGGDGERTPPAPSDLTTVFEPGSEYGGVELTRAWTVDVVVGGAGPVTVFQARVEDDWHDHRFLYARDDDGWETHYLAPAGAGLYDTERDYTGLATLDPSDPTRVFVSTPVDPRDDADLDHHELFAGTTDDGGQSWTWTPLTPDAGTDNLRPLVPAWDDDRTVLAWMRGRYDTFREWDAAAVGVVDPVGTLGE